MTTVDTENRKDFLNIGPKAMAGIFIIFVSVLFAYGNTYNASWHFDDYHSILNNSRLHLENLQPESLYQTFYAAPGGGRYTGKTIYRPVSSLSFALNWYFGKDRVTGYHIANLGIHFLSAVLLFLCLLSLARAPNIRGLFSDFRYAVAILAALLWAVHPIQTQAVTYIVQRMALLAAMFSILSCWLYVKGRNSRSQGHRLTFFSGCLLCYLLAMGSKENAIILPASLLLIEVVFFQDLTGKRGKKVAVIVATMAAVAAVVGVVVLVFSGMLAGYDVRSFTIVERLLTQPRVLIFYLSQIVWPSPDRFSIEHDFEVSTSLLAPWTTLPAILIVMGLIVAALMQIRKRPIWAFPLLFYFLNHSVESTVVPLEMVFEHRNYLPTLFLFLPVSIGIISLRNSLSKRNQYMSGMLHALPILIVLFLAGSSFLRNYAWATEFSLWKNALENAPSRARPYHNLAYHYYEKIGRYDIALKLYNKSLTLRASNPSRSRAQVLTNIGAIYDKAGQYEKAFEFYQQAMAVSPNHLMPRYNAIMALVGMGAWEKALQRADDLISRTPGDKDCNNIKGFILLKLDRPVEAIPYLEKSLEKDPDFFKPLINLGIALYKTGQYDSSESVLRKAASLAPRNGLPLFCLVENRLRAKDVLGTEKYFNKLIATVGLPEIEMVLKSLGENHTMVPLTKQILVPAFIEMTGEKSLPINVSK